MLNELLHSYRSKIIKKNLGGQELQQCWGHIVGVIMRHVEVTQVLTLPQWKTFHETLCSLKMSIFESLKHICGDDSTLYLRRKIVFRESVFGTSLRAVLREVKKEMGVVGR